jgi:uncharacterized protein
MTQKSLIINNLEFAKNQLELSDGLVVAQLPRLAEILTDQGKTQVQFQLSGTGKKFRQPSLHLNIKANLAVTCQRCLDEMLINLNLNFDYLISDTEISEAEENDEIDWLEANHEMDVCELIEDELLLALPIAPTHAHDCSKLNTQSGDKPNPFAVLKGLIK